MEAYIVVCNAVVHEFSCPSPSPSPPIEFTTFLLESGVTESRAGDSWFDLNTVQQVAFSWLCQLAMGPDDELGKLPGLSEVHRLLHPANVNDGVGFTYLRFFKYLTDDNATVATAGQFFPPPGSIASILPVSSIIIKEVIRDDDGLTDYNMTIHFSQNIGDAISRIVHI